MPTYEYKARTAGGLQVAGVMQADSEIAVARALDDKALFPVNVQVRPDARAAGIGRRVSTRDVALLYGQLSDLLSAGVPMLRALETLSRAMPNAALARIIRAVSGDIASGESLADAAAIHPEAFKPLHVAMIRAGERAGFIEEVLANLAAFMDRRDELRSKVRGALIYPIILCSMGIIVVLVMLTVFVPKFQKFFGDMPQPAPTKFLFAVSDTLTANWLLLLGVVVLAVMIIVALFRGDSGRQFWARAQLKLPVIGKLLRIVAISRFCRIFGTMLKNGIPILQALAISKDAAGNAILAQSIASATESVKAGEPLAGPLRADGLFPPEILEMISVAEESNQLEKVLVQIADKVDRRTARQLDVVVKLIEPVILVLIAGVVGLTAVGLLYPIFTMADRLQ